MSTPDDFKEVTAAIRDMSSKLDRMLDGKIREARTKLGPQTPVRLRSTVFIGSHDAAGVSIYTSTIPSIDPARDGARAAAAIELVGAIEREGRDITPDALYTMLVGRKYMPPAVPEV